MLYKVNLVIILGIYPQRIIIASVIAITSFLVVCLPISSNFCKCASLQDLEITWEWRIFLSNVNNMLKKWKNIPNLNIIGIIRPLSFV